MSETSDNKYENLDTTRENNPLLKRLSPQQFSASVKFYEADSKLSNSDRSVIGNDLQTVLYKSAIYGYATAVFNFFIPTMVERLRSKERQVPLFKKVKINSPILSVVLGLSSLILVTDLTANYQFSKKVKELEAHNTEGSSSQRQLDVWRAMDYHQASLFFLYYKKTEVDPSFIIKDPRKFTKEQLHEVHYNPPAKDTHFVNSLGIGSQGSNSSSMPSWDRIRASNGFGSTDTSVSNPEKKSDESGSFSDFHDLSEKDQVLEKPSTEQKSVWEGIRRGSK